MSDRHILSATVQYHDKMRRWIMTLGGDMGTEKIRYVFAFPHELDAATGLAYLHAHHCWTLENPSVHIARQEVWDASWLKPAQAATLMGISMDELERQRREGKWLGIWVEEEFCFLYPPFQFSPLLPAQCLSDLFGILKVGDYKTGWNALTWFIGHHSLLDGQRPIDVILKDPQKVLKAARFSRDPNAW